MVPGFVLWVDLACVIVSVTKNSLCRYVKLTPFCSLKVDLRSPSLMALFLLGFLSA